ncbi:MAG: glycosyl transferase family 2 [Dehalococcoidia bacterium]|nr:glycosyl transferase family 2 [Dehalococcoidia bacterium]
MSPLVTVVVVNWNGLSLLRRCLPAVLVQRGVPYEVIVVDNGSHDGSPEWLQRLSATLAASPRAPSLRILAGKQNVGFAAGNNLAIREAEAPFVATLNNDAMPEPGWLAALVAAAESDPGVGSCASQMVFASSPDVVNSAGIAIDRAGIAWDREVGSVRHRPDPPTEVFGASAGAALYRRAMLEDVGLFAESFFMYLEDVDLAWRARLRHWKCTYAPAAVVRHLHSASAQEGSRFKLWHLGRNKLTVIARCLPGPQLLRYGGAIIGYDLAATLLALTARHDSSGLRGRWAALRRWRELAIERRHIQSRRTAAWDDVSAWIEPVPTPAMVWRRFRHLREVLAGV